MGTPTKCTASGPKVTKARHSTCSRPSRAAQQAREDEKEFGLPVLTRQISGRDLLALFYRADALYLNDTAVAITHAGRLLLETDEVMDAMAIFDALESFQSDHGGHAE
ncbi:hypothetical protein [Paraburkholderia caledonica]|uniref:hypothetical protein n=1 Tax=Paraburkholderia caledonica TaxID=134536 RepID=UPI00339A9A85